MDRVGNFYERNLNNNTKEIVKIIGLEEPSTYKCVSIAITLGSNSTGQKYEIKIIDITRLYFEYVGFKETTESEFTALLSLIEAKLNEIKNGNNA